MQYDITNQMRTSEPRAKIIFKQLVPPCTTHEKRDSREQNLRFTELASTHVSSIHDQADSHHELGSQQILSLPSPEAPSQPISDQPTQYGFRNSFRPPRYDMVPSYDVPIYFPTLSSKIVLNQTSNARGSEHLYETSREWSKLRSGTSMYTHFTLLGPEVPQVRIMECRPRLSPEPFGARVAIAEVMIQLLWSTGPRENPGKSHLLDLRGEAAQAMLDAFQSWLDAHLGHLYRRKVLRLLVDIAAASHELPRSLFVTGTLTHFLMPKKYGGYADVYNGTLDASPVAIKQLRINEDERVKMYRKFCKECLLWRQLSHPNILPFIGVLVEGGKTEAMTSFGMVSPWMKRGTIMAHIRSSEYHARADRQRLIIEVAEGLEYLHGQGIAHGDLHGNNVLITDDYHACLTDFGLTVIGDLTRSWSTTTRNNAGATRWLAPEHVTADSKVARKRSTGDVFAFGRLCLAVCTTRAPYHGLSDIAALLALIADIHPLRPSDAACNGFAMSDTLWDIASDCWARDPSLRPRITDILIQLRSSSSKEA